MSDLLSMAMDLRTRMHNASGAEATLFADDLLVFLQRLNAAFIVYPSKLPAGTAYGPSLLRSWMDRLEASPERACGDDAFRADVTQFLDELCDGSVPVRPRHD